jgi:hypothetical protein
MPCHDDAEGLDRTPAERPRYFEGQLLTADDLRDEQDYWVRKQRLHNIALHGSGVVCGLAVTSQGDGAVTVAPGIAIDRLGREIVVTGPLEIKLATGLGECEVVLRYAEEPSRSSVHGEPTRMREGFEGSGVARRHRTEAGSFSRDSSVPIAPTSPSSSRTRRGPLRTDGFSRSSAH